MSKASAIVWTVPVDTLWQAYVAAAVKLPPAECKAMVEWAGRPQGAIAKPFRSTLTASEANAKRNGREHFAE